MRLIFTNRPNNPMGKLFAVIAAIWLVAYAVGWMWINY